MTNFVLWGVTASPYLLKMQSLIDFAQYPRELWPQQGGYFRALLMLRRLQAAKARGEVRRFPRMNKELDEYPSVPFYSLDGHTFYYDSSSLAQHLDSLCKNDQLPLVPADPEMAFLCHLVDEAFDEFGLYMVHHMRWVGSARTTEMGHRTAAEMGLFSLLPLKHILARSLYRRQSQRCPYLFSVSPEGYDAGVSPGRTPPSMQGFPATHELLESAWKKHLAAMEEILHAQPYILGERFTLADASAYGQLGMNLVDPEAAGLIKQLAPAVYSWLCAIRDGEHRGSQGALRMSSSIRPLLDIIGSTFAPLMVQNEAAYDKASASGETLFNEAAFDQGRALYDGELMGQPFRAVAKTFQVKVWRDLKAHWAALEPSTRDRLCSDLLPWANLLD
jgi:glutathione S-transferase